MGRFLGGKPLTGSHLLGDTKYLLDAGSTASGEDEQRQVTNSSHSLVTHKQFLPAYALLQCPGGFHVSRVFYHPGLSANLFLLCEPLHNL